MNRRKFDRVVLSLVCALALILIPASYSWAQSANQQPTDRNTLDQQNQDANQDKEPVQDDQINKDVDPKADTREKPSSTVTETNVQNENRSNVTESQMKTETKTTSETERSSSTSQRDADESREALPATAGELPLLGLIGLLLLTSAAGTRLIARAKR